MQFWLLESAMGELLDEVLESSMGELLAELLGSVFR